MTTPTTSGNTIIPSAPYHGFACAGIMVAQHNSIDIAGIAPDCSFVSVTADIGFDQQCADGISAAWHPSQGNADVINCSWGGGSFSQLVGDAIDDALTLGRNGLGCVMVFSSGNGNALSIGFPANYTEDIIVVGASSSCGERKSYTSTLGGNTYSCGDVEAWGSNCGDELDVEAPALDNMYTLDEQYTSTPSSGNYMTTFGRTSGAAPQVSAVAALILSLYPCLTQYEVGQIIDQSAWGLLSGSSYTYTNTSAHPFGPWTQAVGYGMLDATAAFHSWLVFLPHHSTCGRVFRSWLV